MHPRLGPHSSPLAGEHLQEEAHRHGGMEEEEEEGHLRYVATPRVACRSIVQRISCLGLGARHALAVTAAALPAPVAPPLTTPRVSPNLWSRGSSRIALARKMLLTAEGALTLFACALSIGFYVWYARRGLTLAYGDAISHMAIARRVFTSRSPGLAQLGSVWPPLNHMLMLPFVWNDALYRSGLGGALPSMAAYVVAGLYLYRTGTLLFASRAAGWVAALALLLNPSVLYMQATPMSEMDLIACAVVAVYYAVRWAKTMDAADLTKCALAVAAGSLIRYDAWALGATLLVIVTVIAWRRRGRSGAESNALLYGMLAFAGCAAWLIYEQVIFGNPLDFFSGPYSASAQEHNIQVASGLDTYHNLPLSLHVYSQVALDAAGTPLGIAALAGLALWIAQTRHNHAAWPAYAVLVPFGFNWLSLVLGVTTIVTPQVPNGGSATYFNVRYGMMMLPAVALFVAFLAVRFRVLLPAVLVLIVVFMAASTFQGTPLALQDPLHGANAVGRTQQTAEAQWLRMHYTGGAILASGGVFTPMMFYSQLPATDYITENDGQVFHAAVSAPQDSDVSWILVDPGNNNFDAVWAALKNRSDWRRDFVLRQTFGTAQFYERVQTGPSPTPSPSPSSTPSPTPNPTP